MNIDPNAKVLMCTSMGGQKWIADELMENGAQQVIEKPYFQDLNLSVNRLLRVLIEELLKARHS